MKLLIVDDDGKRRAQIKECLLESNNLNEHDIDFSGTTDHAKSLLRLNYYDVLILDVVLPKRIDEAPNYTNGMGLLGELSRRSSYNKPERIIGITAYFRDIENFRTQFEELCFNVIEASDRNEIWKSTLIESINYTVSSKVSRIMKESPFQVITVHGIHAFGNWQEQLNEKISSKLNTVSFHSYKYGYITVLSFFIPWFRNRQVAKFKKILHKLYLEHPDKKIVIFSHSFGTYLAAQSIKILLQEGEKLSIDKLILAGSVLPSNYDWSDIINSTGAKIINDCGDSDYVLWLSESLVPGTGMAGKIGFYGLNNDNFVNRYFNGGHGLYFKDDFMDHYWVSLLSGTDGLYVIDERTEDIIHHGIVDNFVSMLGKVKGVTYVFLIIYLFYWLFI